MQNERILYWLDMCDYDFETAKAMLCTKRYLYVGFMCHQVIEKALKAYLCSLSDDEPPYIHSLKRLLTLTGLIDINDCHINLLKNLEPLNIEARYSSYKSGISERLTPEICKDLLLNTEELLLWIKAKL